MFVLPMVLLGFFEVCKSDRWSFTEDLDGDSYRVHWIVKDDIIVFQTEVKCKGYTGFGLSTDGSLVGSDIVIGWLTDGQIYFHDRHGTENGVPEVDLQQDWNLLYAGENDTHTVLKFYRKLQTCDHHDLEIEESTIRLIYTCSNYDPIFINEIDSKWKSKTVMLLRQEPIPIAKMGELTSWDIRSEYHFKPEEKSMHWRKMFKSPFPEKLHIARISTIITTGNEKLIHHFVLWKCQTVQEDILEVWSAETAKTGYKCFTDKNTATPIVVLGAGTKPLEYTEYAGIPIYPGYYQLEIHYDNAVGFTGFDNSGLRLEFAPGLRQYDIGTFQFGDVGIIIPPRIESFKAVAHVNFSHLAPLFPQGGIFITHVLLHIHLLGKKIVLRHFRGNKELRPILRNKYYDFMHQNMEKLATDIHILPGDQLTVECIYNSMERNTTTTWGQSSRHEMCIAILTHYPKFGMLLCPTTSITAAIEKLPGIRHYEGTRVFENESFQSDIKAYNWADVDISEFENYVCNSARKACLPPGTKMNDFTTMIAYPENFMPYIEPSPCNYNKWQRMEQTQMLYSNQTLLKPCFDMIIAFVLFLSCIKAML